jgi:hypothetical protein
VRRNFTGRISGDQSRRRIQPLRLRPDTLANGPRTVTSTSDNDTVRSAKTISAPVPSDVHCKEKFLRRLSRRTNISAWPKANKASGALASSGSALMARDNAAIAPMATKAKDSKRDGRQSMGKLDDSLDKGAQLRVFGPFATHAPLPKLIVFAVEQA